MRVLQKLRNGFHCLSWSSPVLCLRICPHINPENRNELCAVTNTRPWKLISPFRLEDSSLQDWHWALDDIDDDCSSIHFWSPHLVTLCAMCAVQCLPFKKTLKMSDLSPRRSNGFKIKREDSSSTWYKWQLLLLLLLLLVLLLTRCFPVNISASQCVYVCLFWVSLWGGAGGEYTLYYGAGATY